MPPPKTPKTSLSPSRSQGTTARDPVPPISRDPQPPQESTISLANLANSGPVMLDIGNCRSSMETIDKPESNNSFNNNLVVIPENSGSVRPELHNCSVEIEPERMANVGGSSGKKTVLRRVVRVIKKVVKKKVLKKVNLGIKEEAEIGNFENSYKKDENLEMITNVSESMGVEKVDSAIIATEAENVNLNGSVGAEDTFSYKKDENLELITSVSEVMEVKKVDSTIDATERISLVKLPEVVPLKGKTSLGLVKDKSMGVIGVKEQMKNNSNTMNQGPVVLSGEMEALKRRKRRKTEIFIGGLDRDTKELDIRKVFEEFGEIMEVRLAMNHKTGQNKGFAFVKYSSADEATRALLRYRKVEIRGKKCGVQPVKGKQTKHSSNTTPKDRRKEKRKATHSITKPREPKIMRTYTGNIHEQSAADAELVQLLKQKALNRQAQQIGYATLSHHSPSLGSNRPFSAMVHDPVPSDFRGYAQFPLRCSNPVQSSSSMPYGVTYASSSAHNYQQGLCYAPCAASASGDRNYPSQSQTRQQVFYYGNNDVHRQY